MEISARVPGTSNIYGKKKITGRDSEKKCMETIPESFGRGRPVAEFGKIICIVIGFIQKNTMLSFGSFMVGDDEVKLLKEFTVFLENHKPFGNRPVQLCAHNGKEFDYPYIARRMIINRLKIPSLLDNAGKKTMGGAIN